MQRRDTAGPMVPQSRNRCALELALEVPSRSTVGKLVGVNVDVVAIRSAVDGFEKTMVDVDATFEALAPVKTLPVF